MLTNHVPVSKRNSVGNHVGHLLLAGLLPILDRSQSSEEAA